MPQFSVLIPVYNGANFLDEALQSIADQSLDDVQVVVSDNASRDQTPQIVDNWREKLNLRVITQASTISMQANFNALLDAVDTEFYMLLCHDDYLADPDTLRLARDALLGAPHVAAVYSDLIYVNPKRRPLARYIFRRGQLFSADQAGLKTLRAARNQFGIPVGIRRSCLGDLRYDPAFHYIMDVDLSWAMSRHQDLAHIPKALVANRYGRTNMTWALLSTAHDEFVGLARKYSVAMGPIDRLRLRLVTMLVRQQKRVFSLYMAYVAWRG